MFLLKLFFDFDKCVIVVNYFCSLFEVVVLVVVNKCVVNILVKEVVFMGEIVEFKLFEDVEKVFYVEI